MVHFAIPVLISSFLNFQIQPIMARYVLPIFGGNAAVWTSCILFFQVILLLGYGYSYFLTAKLSLKYQTIVHGLLLMGSLHFLPIRLSDIWLSMTSYSPVLQIFILLLLTVGGPYLLISATGPLLQSWMGHTVQHKSPYRLYAISNMAGIIGLLSYPFLIEPIMGLKTQTIVWGAAYLLFVIISLYCVLRIYRQFHRVSQPTIGSVNTVAQHHQTAPLDSKTQNPYQWALLSGLGCILLLAATNQMTQVSSPIPFVWVWPLSLYLLSMAICFRPGPLLFARLWTPLFYLNVLPALVLLFFGSYLEPILRFIWHSQMLFTSCMICHSRLAQSKPAVTKLTSFYFVIAFGGILGSTLVALVAPYIFSRFWELQLSWLVVYSLIGYKHYQSLKISSPKEKSITRAKVKFWAWATGLALIVATAIFYQVLLKKALIYNSRNFYGLLGIRDRNIVGGDKLRFLLDGDTHHGIQHLVSKEKRRLFSYYRPATGVGLAMNFHAHQRVGIIGLGIGTLAHYATSEDQFTFYEINPAVVAVAENYFDHLKDSPAKINIVMGDARLSLARELKTKSQNFDLLVIDAFSNDMIPVHLLTQEAYAIYWSHLKADGILAFHISNKMFKLTPVVRALASSNNKIMLKIDTPPNTVESGSTDWLLLTSNATFYSHPEVKKALTPQTANSPQVLWTDDYSDLFSVFNSNIIE